MSSHGICLVVEDDSDIPELLRLIHSAASFEVPAEAACADDPGAAQALDPVLITLGACRTHAGTRSYRPSGNSRQPPSVTKPFRQAQLVEATARASS